MTGGIFVLVAILFSVHDLAAQVPGDDPEVLRPGDLIRIAVWRQPEFSGEFSVNEGGSVAHPLMQEVTVAGRPVSEVGPAIRTFMRTYEAEPNVAIEPFFRVVVAGEVRAPNVQMLRPGTTIPQAIASAGGYTERADLEDIVLRRGARDHPIDLRDPASVYVTTTIRSGDQIVVGRDTAILRDYILPAVSFLGSAAAIYRVFDR